MITQENHELKQKLKECEQQYYHHRPVTSTFKKLGNFFKRSAETPGEHDVKGSHDESPWIDVPQPISLKAKIDKINRNLVNVNVTCEKNHKLEIEYQNCYSKFSTVGCDICSADCIDLHDYFYHCGECSYDICAHCALQKTNQIITTKDETLQSSLHIHSLTKTAPGKARDWHCDGIHVFGECQSSNRCSHNNTTLQGYHCEPCDIDFCIQCVIKMGMVLHKNREGTEIRLAQNYKFYCSTDYHQAQTYDNYNSQLSISKFGEHQKKIVGSKVYQVLEKNQDAVELNNKIYVYT